MSLINILKKKIKIDLFTTPSHSQKLFLFPKFKQFYKYDISETDAYNPQEALKLAEEKACKIYGTKSTHFLTNGSTSGIIAAVLACVKQGEQVLIWDKAHPSHKNAVMLTGAEPVFYELKKNTEWGIYGATPSEVIEEKLKLHAFTDPSPQPSPARGEGAGYKNGSSYVIDEISMGEPQPPSSSGEGTRCKNAFCTIDDVGTRESQNILPRPLRERAGVRGNIKAVIITSPTYEGITSDIQKIKEICKKYGAYLIVDEAHGALYPFCDKLPPSAIYGRNTPHSSHTLQVTPHLGPLTRPFGAALKGSHTSYLSGSLCFPHGERKNNYFCNSEGADFVIQSLHKTAGGLNPTALLHCNVDFGNDLTNVPPPHPSPSRGEGVRCENAAFCTTDEVCILENQHILPPPLRGRGGGVKAALELISTTSPSYPLLASIEKNINFLNSKKGRRKILELIENIENLKKNVPNCEFYEDNDPTKILVKVPGLSGFELSEILFKKYKIEDERANEKSVMLLCGIGTNLKKLKRLEKALRNLYVG